MKIRVTKDIEAKDIPEALKKYRSGKVIYVEVIEDEEEEKHVGFNQK